MKLPRNGEIQRILSSLDPAAGPSVITDTDRGHDLQRIMSTDRSTRRTVNRPRRRLIAAVAAAAVVLAGFELLPRPQPTFAATPAPLAYSASAQPAATLLTAIAARAAATPPPVRAGDYEHLVTLSWDLWTQVDGGRVQSAVVPARSESWRGPDNSGKIKSGKQAPQFPNGSDRLTWLLDRAPGLLPSDHTITYPAGTFPALWPDQPPAAGVNTWLERGHPATNGPAETIVAITDLARERLLTPATRAAVLRTVAALPGLTYDGDVTDRAGRAGQAFSLTSAYTGLPTKYTLVVNPDTGQLLDYEMTLTETAGKLNVKIPAVIGYEVYVKGEFTTAP